MNTKAIQGCGTALVTPFDGDVVDQAALRRLVEAQIAAGVDFLVPCGTTGESPTLTDPERVQVIETVVDAAAGRVPIVAGTGTNDTPHSIAMTKAAKAAGADACLAVSPYYNKPTQEGLYRHFRAMIDEGGLGEVVVNLKLRSILCVPFSFQE
ncbi:MAG: dihydrodipicolinate synthase family protein, partial [Planctomycetota bacterium]|nr:dihydrodipicolinate synthase family protein [Planctomycetota bacterium]